MKKNVAKILTLVLVVAMCAACFAACVPSKYDKAAANLEAAGFTVSKGTADSTGADAIAFASGEGIVDSVIKTPADSKQLTAFVSAQKGDDEITIFYFADAKYAKAFYKMIKLSSDGEYDQAKILHDAGTMKDADWEKEKADRKAGCRGRNGKVVWFGTDVAEKAAN